MAQQINLHSPILLAPERVFSATAVARALALLVAALAVIGGWSQWRTLAIRAEIGRATATWQAEKRQLDAALAQSQPASAAALDQQIAQARTRLADRQLLLQTLARQAGTDGDARASMLLRLLARTVPAQTWLTDIRRTDGRVELAGSTLQPELLQPWLALLEADPALQGRTLATVTVERNGDRDGGAAWMGSSDRGTASGDGNGTPSSTAGRDSGAGADGWRFRIVSRGVDR